MVAAAAVVVAKHCCRRQRKCYLLALDDSSTLLDSSMELTLMNRRADVVAVDRMSWPSGSDWCCKNWLWLVWQTIWTSLVRFDTSFCGLLLTELTSAAVDAVALFFC